MYHLAWHQQVSAGDTALYTALAMDVMSWYSTARSMLVPLKESAYGCTILIVLFAGLLVDELMKAHLETQAAPPPSASAQAAEST